MLRDGACSNSRNTPSRPHRGVSGRSRRKPILVCRHGSRMPPVCSSASRTAWQRRPRRRNITASSMCFAQNSAPAACRPKTRGGSVSSDLHCNRPATPPPRPTCRRRQRKEGQGARRSWRGGTRVASRFQNSRHGLVEFGFQCFHWFTDFREIWASLTFDCRQGVPKRFNLLHEDRGKSV
jgi:hypothetical protein